MKCGLVLVAGLAVAAGCDGGGGTEVQADYALSLSQAALTIIQGANGNTTVTITRTSFTDAVTLSVGNLPAGVTGSFNPAAPTGDNSTLTLTVGAAVAPGVYNLTVDGTGTPGNRSTPLALTVSPPPDYALSLNPAALTIVQGGNGNTAVTLTRTNFTGGVTLSLGGAPAGVTGAFNPAAPTGTASTLTVSVGAAVAPGVYNLTVDGTGTPGARSTPLTLTVTGQVPTVSFTAAAQTVNEGVGTATITAQLSSSSTQAVTVPFTVGGTAANPADYTISASPITIAAGSTSGTITVTVVADGVAEPDETVIVTLGTPTNATRGATTVHTLTIAAQVPTVSFTAAAQTVGEGVGTATITAQLSSSSTQPVTVPFTVGGTAANPADYTISASPITIPAGNTTGTITVTVVADGVAEPDETVIVTLGTPTNATLGATTVHTVTITGQVPTVSFTAAAQSVAEGVGTATITAQLSSSSAQTVTVPFTVGGTATNPADYTISASPITIPAGNTTGTITVTVVADAVAEPNETVVVTMGTPTNAAQGATTVHTVTITGQVPTVSFTAAAQTVAEGVGTATITAQLSSSSTQAVTVPFTVSGTATSPADYTISASPITIPAGNTTGTITVTVVADAVAEPNETVVVTMGTPTNAAQGATTVHTLTITGQVPTVSFTAAAQSVAEGVGTATITAQLSSSSTQVVTVPFTVGGTATNPADYTISASPLTIPAGNTTGTITVTVVADGVAEPDETVIVTLGTPTNATLGATTVHTLTVSAGAGSGNVTLDFSACPVAERPLWVAGQDGSGAWAAVTGVNNVYQFNVTTGRGAYAFVLSSAGSTQTIVQFYTQAEITAIPFVFCGPGPTGKTVTGTAAGLGAPDQALISLGGRLAPVVTPATLNFTITGIPSGLQDLVGYRRALIGGTVGQSAIIRRDQNITDGGSVGTMDFAGGEAFVPANATITVGGLAGGESVPLHSMDYRVGAGCESAPLYSLGDGGTSFTASGIPALQQRASDFHGISISAQNAATGGFRTIVEYFHTLANRTVTLGAAMPTPTITTLAAPYKRLQAVYTLPADFNFVTQFTYSSGGRGATLIATLGYLAGPATTLAFADYSGLAGWDNNWMPATTDTGDWTTEATGGTLVSLCTENANRKVALVSGTF
jgi:acylphosphatase